MKFDFDDIKAPLAVAFSVLVLMAVNDPVVAAYGMIVLVGAAVISFVAKSTTKLPIGPVAASLFLVYFIALAFALFFGSGLTFVAVSKMDMLVTILLIAALGMVSEGAVEFGAAAIGK